MAGLAERAHALSRIRTTDAVCTMARIMTTTQVDSNPPFDPDWVFSANLGRRCSVRSGVREG